MKKKLVKIVGLLLISYCSIFHTNTTLNAQCAVCRTSVESLDGDDSEIKEGVNSGILYLMGIPYVILIGSIWLAIRYHKAQKEEEKSLKEKSKIDDTPLA